MNIGVRYEYNSPITDIGGQSRNFDFTKQDLFPAVLTKGPLNDPEQEIVRSAHRLRMASVWRE